jgi:hypothetical protein
MAPRFPHTLTLIRPTLGSDGDWSFAAGTAVNGALFRRRRKAIVAGQGEQAIVTAQAFLPLGTDVQLNDRLERGSDRFVVLNVVVGEDDDSRTDHIGVELGDVAGEA